MRTDWIKNRTETNVSQLSYARNGIITEEMKYVAEAEYLEPELIRKEIADGKLIIPANINHTKLKPVGIGRAVRCKINANIGNSSIHSDVTNELCKLSTAIRYGADAVMDLSTGGDITKIRKTIIANSEVPVGTVPVYQASQMVERIYDLSADELISVIEDQAKEGVDFMTIHCGLLREHIPLAKKRLTGIVSRGGSLMGQWMAHHKKENPFYTEFDRILEVCQKYDVSLSLGDGLRPGCLADASDEAQFAELDVLGELTKRCHEAEVQVMIEGPGHVPFDEIEMNVKKEIEICNGAPFYVLGPIVTDIAPGYDHITSAIGATMAGYSGASMLCYVTPKEHLGLPTLDDVRNGVVAYKIAAHAIDIALKKPNARNRDDEMSKARADFDWDRQFELALDPETAKIMYNQSFTKEEDINKDYCSMCGPKFCAMKITKEIDK